MEITILSNKYIQMYTEFLLKSSKNLFFASNAYRELLKRYTKDEDYYLIALEGNEIKGVIPSFLKKTSLGNCLNSLPYYGSNGGIIEHDKNLDVKRALLKAFEQLAIDNSCVSSTIITSPFENEIDFYDNNVNYDYKGYRIGLLTELQRLDKLLYSIDSKARRDMKQAERNGVIVEVDNSKESLEFLISEHQSSMHKIGGQIKEREFFETLYRLLLAGRDFNIYIGNINGERVAALLLFYYNKTVEYFTPVTLEKYRSKQPTSLIIPIAMSDAYEKGFKYWNWGGTQAHQIGVYKFKKKWSSIERNYYYYTKVYNESIKSAPADKILETFKNYFVIPFDR